MVYTDPSAREVASWLLQIKAIQLNPQNPFTWASGIQSPIYCDNRKTLAYPAIRNRIKEHFGRLIKAKFPLVNLIAGVATAGIAHGALAADFLGLPFVYVRAKPKEHGLQNLIEGEVKGGEHVVVIEDLISTGGSSLKAVDALETAGCNVEGVAAIFSYGFEDSHKRFEDKNLLLFTLSHYEIMIDEAVRQGYVMESDLLMLQQWRENRTEWAVR